MKEKRSAVGNFYNLALDGAGQGLKPFPSVLASTVGMHGATPGPGTLEACSPPSRKSPGTGHRPGLETRLEGLLSTLPLTTPELPSVTPSTFKSRETAVRPVITQSCPSASLPGKYSAAAISLSNGAPRPQGTLSGFRKGFPGKPGGGYAGSGSSCVRGVTPRPRQRLEADTRSALAGLAPHPAATPSPRRRPHGQWSPGLSRAQEPPGNRDGLGCLRCPGALHCRRHMAPNSARRKPAVVTSRNAPEADHREGAGGSRE